MLLLRTGDHREKNVVDPTERPLLPISLAYECFEDKSYKCCHTSNHKQIYTQAYYTDGVINFSQFNSQILVIN